jgi:2-polyprenyl-3-methyl-5-hydroxy-6-metoxy-1,4-benzoquinol methylase
LRDGEQAPGFSMNTIRADLGRWLPTQPTAGFDVVVCTEVLYLRPNHRTLLEQLIRVLKPGGLCFISHRQRSRK